MIEGRVMDIDFEASDNCQTHEILSDNVLVCAETGRVVAVFYNDYDLDRVVDALILAKQQ